MDITLWQHIIGICQHEYRQKQRSKNKKKLRNRLTNPKAHDMFTLIIEPSKKSYGLRSVG